jgi:hypothetical protein
MKKLLTPLLVTAIMLIGILGITNPALRQPYKLFNSVEGRLADNYFIFSVYNQYKGYTYTKDGKYIVYKRFIGIAFHFYEISPLLIENK